MGKLDTGLTQTCSITMTGFGRICAFGGLHDGDRISGFGAGPNPPGRAVNGTRFFALLRAVGPLAAEFGSTAPSCFERVFLQTAQTDPERPRAGPADALKTSEDIPLHPGRLAGMPTEHGEQRRSRYAHATRSVRTLPSGGRVATRAIHPLRPQGIPRPARRHRQTQRPGHLGGQVFGGR